MTDRLDKIESILAATAERLDSTAEKLDRTAERSESNQKDIEALLESISNLAVLAEGNEQRMTRLEKLVEANSQASAANATRFDVLSADAKADRKRADQDRAAWQAGFAEQMAEIRLLRLDVHSLDNRVDTLEQAS